MKVLDKLILLATIEYRPSKGNRICGDMLNRLTPEERKELSELKSNDISNIRL